MTDTYSTTDLRKRVKQMIESFDVHGGMAALSKASGVAEHAIRKFTAGQRTVVKRLHDYLGVQWDPHRGVYVRFRSEGEAVVSINDGLAKENVKLTLENRGLRQQVTTLQKRLDEVKQREAA